MSVDTKKLAQWLFELEAVKVCKPNKPFWYTSSLIGPLYINTHFLYGGKESAELLLQKIDEAQEFMLSCPNIIGESTYRFYNENKSYKELMDMMVDYVAESIDLNEISAVSGGARRDWFFSLVLAKLIKKPHISIYKNLEMTITDINGNSVHVKTKDLKEKKILHVADLVTEASSYTRAWIPAIKNAGGEIKWSLFVVDRQQGGREILESRGIQTLPMVSIDNEIFEKALESGYINSSQYKMLCKYKAQPFETMREFLIKNPDYLTKALKSDSKTSARAKHLVENDLYQLKK